MFVNAFGIVLMLAGQTAPTFDLERLKRHPARASLVATASCATDAEDDGEIVVCGARRDAYRLPLPHDQVQTASHDGSATDLVKAPSPVQSMSPFLVGGGMVGVTTGTHSALGTKGG